MNEVVIAVAARTPIGSYGGVFKNTPATELGGLVIRSVLQQTQLPASRVDEVIMGNVLSAGLGQNPARQMAMNGGIPQEVPSITLNKVCGSGLRAVTVATQIIKTGDAQCIVCGGSENMSQVPYLLPGMRWGARMGDGVAVDSLVNDGLHDAFHSCHMGMTAENVASRWKISREEQDAFALDSQQKALKAQEEGAFQDEIVPVPTVQKRNQELLVDQDEHPRSTSLEKLASLKPAFQKDGTVTAGNASGINDGAAALLVTSREFAEEAELPVLAVIRGYGTAGVDPAYMGYGPVPASKKALKMAGWEIADLDIVEANEAFASQCIAVLRELCLDPAKVNVNGGAIALGHPIGCSGARILTTLLHSMNKRNAKKGLATLCIGGGMGTAICVEKDA